MQISFRNYVRRVIDFKSRRSNELPFVCGDLNLNTQDYPKHEIDDVFQSWQSEFGIEYDVYCQAIESLLVAS